MTITPLEIATTNASLARTDLKKLADSVEALTKRIENLERVRWPRNAESRAGFVKRFVGRTAHVTELSRGPNPKEINYQGLYVPLPEYGIALWLGDDPNRTTFIRKD